MPYIVLIITIVILLFPIPINLKINYENKKIQFFIYNKKLNFKKNKNKNNLFNFNKTTQKIDFKNLNSPIEKIKLNKFMKPKLNIKYTIIYGTEEASNTAIIYGILNIFPSYIYRALNLFFKINKYNHNIIPIFNSVQLNIKIECIIIINTTKIIYILLKFLILILQRRNIHGK